MLFLPWQDLRKALTRFGERFNKATIRRIVEQQVCNKIQPLTSSNDLNHFKSTFVGRRWLLRRRNDPQFYNNCSMEQDLSGFKMELTKIIIYLQHKRFINKFS